MKPDNMITSAREGLRRCWVRRHDNPQWRVSVRRWANLLRALQSAR